MTPEPTAPPAPAEPTAEPTLTSVPLADLPSLVGTTFGPSSWRTITQDEVDRFADLTGDRNPIHLDPVHAAGTPFGGTIVHGYLTLALVVPLMAQVVEVTGVTTGVNYGLDRLRFPAPVRVGSRIRVTSRLSDVTEVAGGYQAVFENSFEAEGLAKPAAVAVMIVRYYA
ncbi:MaoC family dehydratase [Cellulomonas wangsupingiae]|uniref:MaoC family dehydratase n=1 Tax=Cellulomonas wangsupingiae TaxID=2968085 RepID=UPI001D0E001B|nr:MaoC family dehydratase [Cellulomonas wangsupingiae]MCM0638895.1 MaoC family dehydratase [Cellulomonas wangsupingiae]